MTVSSERIFWYPFNGFLHVDNFVMELFSCKNAGDEPQEVVPSHLHPKQCFLGPFYHKIILVLF